MKSLKFFTAFLSVIFSFGIMTQTLNAQSKDTLTWYNDLSKATEVSNSTGKPIFALFTGSDWCIWCKKLDKDVLSKAEFIAWAKQNVVLLYLDFPRYKQLPPELKQQNQNLLQQFKVQGFPTVWMFSLSTDEKTKQVTCSPLGSCGYPQNAQAGNEQVKFLKDANAILANKK